MKATMKGRRVFYFSVFLLLALLLVGTMAFAEGSGPYSLTIRKVLPAGSPPEAFQQSYKFKVSGVEKSGDENKPFSKVVTITGPGEATVDIGNPYYVSAVEALDKLEIPGYKLDVNYSGSTTVPGQKAEVEITKDNGSITVSIADPEQAAAGVSYGYEITGPNGYKETMRISGTEKKTVSGLAAGTYTVVQLGSAKGFSVAVDTDDIHVEAGKECWINFPTDDGKLCIIAPDDGQEHTYILKNSSGSFSKETDALGPNKKTHTFENLLLGRYSVSEKIYEGLKPYSVTVPKTTVERNISLTHTNIVTGSDGTITNYAGKYRHYTLKESYRSVDYFTLNVSNLVSTLPKGTQYKFYVKGHWSDDPSDTVPRNTSLKAGTNYDRIMTARKLVPGIDGKFSLAVSSQDITSIKFILTPHTYSNDTFNFKNVNISNNVTIDDRGWLEISKPADTTPGAEQVTYSYTVTDSKGKKQTVELEAGETKKVDGLAEGQCTVEQTVQTASPKPFTIRKQSYASASTAKAMLTCALATADGQITISKPKPDSADLERVYHFTVTGPNGFAEQTVELKAGEEIVLTPGYAGEYSIYALDDDDPGFYLDFTNSCTVYSGKSEIVVTNSYVQAPASYNVVHEYYGLNGELEDISEIQKDIPGEIGQEFTDQNVGRRLIGPNFGYTYVFEEAVYGNMSNLPEPPALLKRQYTIAYFKDGTPYGEVETFKIGRASCRERV